MTIMIYATVSLLAIACWIVVKKRLSLFEQLFVLLSGNFLAIQYTTIVSLNLNRITFPVQLADHWAFILHRSVIVPLLFAGAVNVSFASRPAGLKWAVWTLTVLAAAASEYGLVQLQAIRYSAWNAALSLAVWSVIAVCVIALSIAFRRVLRWERSFG